MTGDKLQSPSWHCLPVTESWRKSSILFPSFPEASANCVRIAFDALKSHGKESYLCDTLASNPVHTPADSVYYKPFFEKTDNNRFQLDVKDAEKVIMDGRNCMEQKLHVPDKSSSSPPPLQQISDFTDIRSAVSEKEHEDPQTNTTSLLCARVHVTCTSCKNAK
jgi:hypothetical protein